MEIIMERTYTEVHVVLTQGQDFTVEELEPDLLIGGELMNLKAESLKRITDKHGYDEWTWRGHYREEDRTVAATIRKALAV